MNKGASPVNACLNKRTQLFSLASCLSSLVCFTKQTQYLHFHSKIEGSLSQLHKTKPILLSSQFYFLKTENTKRTQTYPVNLIMKNTKQTQIIAFSTQKHALPKKQTHFKSRWPLCSQ
jgi:hypothetical protein